MGALLSGQAPRVGRRVRWSRSIKLKPRSLRLHGGALIRAATQPGSITATASAMLRQEAAGCHCCFRARDFARADIDTVQLLPSPAPEPASHAAAHRCGPGKAVPARCSSLRVSLGLLAFENLEPYPSRARRRTTEEQHQLAPPRSMTSSSRARIVADRPRNVRRRMVSAIARAVRPIARF
jgi:hypothetical protein